jgi:hypothetical protein
LDRAAAFFLLIPRGQLNGHERGAFSRLKQATKNAFERWVKNGSQLDGGSRPFDDKPLPMAKVLQLCFYSATNPGAY